MKAKINDYYRRLIEFAQTELESVHNIKSALTNAAWWGSGVFLILLLMRPFGISDEDYSRFLLTCIGYGVITFTIFFVNNISSRLFISKAFDAKWHIAHEMLLILIVLPQLAGFNYLFYVLTNADESFSRIGWLKILFYTFDLMLILALVGTIYRLVKSYRKESVILQTKNEYYIELNKLRRILDASDQAILLNFESGQMSLQRDSILFIHAWGNYIKIYLHSDNEVFQIVRRGKLKNTLQELSAYTEFIHCHRSYILNIKHVKKLSGTNKKPEAILSAGKLSVPISRESIKNVRLLFEKLQNQKLSVSNS